MLSGCACRQMVFFFFIFISWKTIYDAVKTIQMSVRRSIVNRTAAAGLTRNELARVNLSAVHTIRYVDTRVTGERWE